MIKPVNKRFKAFVLTKKTIIFSIFIIILSITLIVSQKIVSQNDAGNQIASKDGITGLILSQKLHTKDSESIGIIERILGFNPKEPETILYNYLDYEKSHSVDQNDYLYPEVPKTPEPAPTPAPEQQFPIEEVNIAKGMSISNSTNLTVDTASLISQPLSYSVDTNEPLILIVHTHTTESYTDSAKTTYTASDSDRSTDEAKNMTTVGRALYDTLTARGINVIHDTTVHDYPAYNGSYNRAKATIMKNLEKYPSIKIVFDVHRDGIVRADGTKVKVSCDVEGQNAAQCMFVVGSNEELAHDKWLENMKLAAKIQNKANEMYPGFMRPINLRSERFNQQLSPGSLIIEVGSNGNTLDEAVYSAKLMGNVIATLFGK